MPEGEESKVAQVVRFVLEIDKLKAVSRKTRPVGLERRENSAEHSWQLAVFALALIPSLTTKVRLDHVVEMLLVHDIGEIDAGDTFLFANISREDQKGPELAAVTRIFGLLSPETGSRLLELWKEFEFGDSVEARLARAIDRAMPALLNVANSGGTWQEFGISYERVIARIEPEVRDVCPDLWDVLKTRIDDAHDQGYFAG